MHRLPVVARHHALFRFDWKCRRQLKAVWSRRGANAMAGAAKARRSAPRGQPPLPRRNRRCSRSRRGAPGSSCRGSSCRGTSRGKSCAATGRRAGSATQRRPHPQPAPAQHCGCRLCCCTAHFPGTRRRAIGSPPSRCRADTGRRRSDCHSCRACSGGAGDGSCRSRRPRSGRAGGTGGRKVRV